MLRTLGSLWFAASLLILLLVAMACATVFEASHGTEPTLSAFYKPWWFQLLLALLAVNVLAAVVVRYPFSRRQVGFVITHTSILVILAGAVVTKRWGVDGQVGIAENQTVTDFNVRQDTLSLVKQGGDAPMSNTVDLDRSVFGEFVAVDHPKAPVLNLDNVRVAVTRYLPDSIEVERIVDDNPRDRPAVEVSLSPSGLDDATWIFAGQKQTLGTVAATFRVVSSREELARLLADTPAASQPASKGTLRVEYQGATHELPLDACMAQAVPVGGTGYTVRVIRYLPHAVVGANHQIVNASEQPMNPAIEAEFVGPTETLKRLAFAKFPDFQSMHSKETQGLKLTFVSGASDTAGAIPLQVLAGPGDEFHVRFAPDDGKITSARLSVGTPVASPWPGHKFSILRRFAHARVDQSVEPADPIRKNRIPAILVQVSTASHTSEMWLQRQRPHPVTVDHTTYELLYGDKAIPLGFAITLNRFQIGYYPGERRPRSFESQITIEDPAAGRTQSRLISMNNPTTYGGYTFYQSSYRQEEGRTVSFLSVSRDPGQPIVFAGYIILMIGMLVVMGTRMLERRMIAGASASRPERAEAARGQPGCSATRLQQGCSRSCGDGERWCLRSLVTPNTAWEQ